MIWKFTLKKPFGETLVKMNVFYFFPENIYMYIYIYTHIKTKVLTSWFYFKFFKKQKRSGTSLPVSFTFPAWFLNKHICQFMYY